MFNPTNIIENDANKPSCPAGVSGLMGASKASSAKAGTSPAPAGNGDITQPLMYAFLLLIDSIDIQSQSSIIKAKQLASNAGAQQRLNDELRDIQWITVPKIVYNNHVQKNTHWKIGPHTPDGGNILVKTYTYVTWKTIANKTVIQQANAQNQENNKIRQDLETKMSILQQLAQAGETSVNTDVNEEMKTTQEANALLSLLKELTDKILQKNY